MLRNLRSLLGYTVSASDGDIGTVDDFYFDDETWTLRYLVVNTGDWLNGRRVLLTPASLGRPGWSESIFPVDLTRRQVQDSPDVSTDKPVSRQHEERLHRYYGWEPYWNLGYYPGPPGMGSGIFVGIPPVATMPESAVATETKPASPSLRSANEVIGYRLVTAQGRSGRIDDFLIDDKTWTIRYLVVDTRTWLPGKKVLLPSLWVNRVNWPHNTVTVDVDRQTIRNSPTYDPSRRLTRDDEEELSAYFCGLKP